MRPSRRHGTDDDAFDFFGGLRQILGVKVPSSSFELPKRIHVACTLSMSKAGDLKGWHRLADDAFFDKERCP